MTCLRPRSAVTVFKLHRSAEGWGRSQRPRRSRLVCVHDCLVGRTTGCWRGAGRRTTPCCRSVLQARSQKAVIRAKTANQPNAKASTEQLGELLIDGPSESLRRKRISVRVGLSPLLHYLKGPRSACRFRMRRRRWIQHAAGTILVLTGLRPVTPTSQGRAESNRPDGWSRTSRTGS